MGMGAAREEQGRLWDALDCYQVSDTTCLTAPCTYAVQCPILA